MRDMEMEREPEKKEKEKGPVFAQGMENPPPPKKTNETDRERERGIETSEDESSWVVVECNENNSGRFKLKMCKDVKFKKNTFMKRDVVEFSCVYEADQIQDVNVLDDKKGNMKKSKAAILKAATKHLANKIVVDTVTDLLNI